MRTEGIDYVKSFNDLTRNLTQNLLSLGTVPQPVTPLLAPYYNVKNNVTFTVAVPIIIVAL